MENICEWENCKENGKFKAPIERDNSKNFRWLCAEHIKLFNKDFENAHDAMSDISATADCFFELEQKNNLD